MMTTLMMCWCLLSMDVFLWPIAPTVAEVVEKMSDCPGFILEEIPPNITDVLEGANSQNQNRYKVICQTYKNTRRFVTLYDTKNRIPVFSAGKINRMGGGSRPPPHWKIEPQLWQLQVKESVKESMSNMWDDVVIKNQATNTDYINQSYSRGHLFPCCYGYNDDDKISTFTLTNIVPQPQSFNGGSWSKMENCVKCVMEAYCKNNNNATEAFVVTGAKPGQEKLNKRVNIPSVLWSAFCCYSNVKGKWLASAHWGNNIEQEPSEYLQTKTLEELGRKLGIEAFPNNKLCPLNETVAEYYREKEIIDPKNHCHCPPQPPTTPAPTTTATPAPTTTATATTRAISMVKYPSNWLYRICANRLGMQRNLQRRERLKLMRECRKIRRDLLAHSMIEIPSDYVLAKIYRELIL